MKKQRGRVELRYTHESLDSPAPAKAHTLERSTRPERQLHERLHLQSANRVLTHEILTSFALTEIQCPIMMPRKPRELSALSDAMHGTYRYRRSTRSVAQAFLLTLFAILIALALFVWRARPQSRINQSFTAFTVFVACWVLGVAGLQGGSHLNAWGRFTFASAVLIPLAFLELTHVYPTRSNWPRREIRMALRYIGLAIAIISVATPFVVRDNVVTPHGVQRQSGSLYPLFFFYFLTFWLIAVILLLR